MTQPETLAKQIRVELEAQPAPRTYEVARALSVLDDFERRSPAQTSVEAAAWEINQFCIACGFSHRYPQPKEIAAIIRKHISEGKMPGWQKIETAPKDGK